MIDRKYAICKGKVLTMVREYLKVYPSASVGDIMSRIHYEVSTAIWMVYGGYYQTVLDELTDEIAKEVCICEK